MDGLGQAILPFAANQLLGTKVFDLAKEVQALRPTGRQQCGQATAAAVSHLHREMVRRRGAQQFGSGMQIGCESYSTCF